MTVIELAALSPIESYAVAVILYITFGLLGTLQLQLKGDVVVEQTNLPFTVKLLVVIFDESLVVIVTVERLATIPAFIGYVIDTVTF